MNGSAPDESAPRTPLGRRSLMRRLTNGLVVIGASVGLVTLVRTCHVSRLHNPKRQKRQKRLKCIGKVIVRVKALIGMRKKKATPDRNKSSSESESESENRSSATEPSIPMGAIIGELIVDSLIGGLAMGPTMGGLPMGSRSGGLTPWRG